MSHQSFAETWRRWRTARTHRLHSLPIAILMPHSGCNCRCVMCDIWKGNGNRQLLQEEDIRQLLESFRRLHTRQVLLSGGEALLHPQFFRFCELLRAEGLYITLLSTGITLEKHAAQLVNDVDEVIVSLDGDPAIHDAIRNIPGAFDRLAAGVKALQQAKPSFRISGRSVLQRANFRHWSAIVDTARSIGLHSISFLPADTGSSAFNRPEPWTEARADGVAIPEEEWPQLEAAYKELLWAQEAAIKSRFILESPEKLAAIVTYYKALQGKVDFPVKSCNAPWVSAVVEADGSVRPCFFLDAYGSLRDQSFESLVNSREAQDLRRQWQANAPDACTRCVCSLHLPVHQNPLPA
jgi:MoaA/NifB/PqqE/SkfB family radical SAM enzyme